MTYTWSDCLAEQREREENMENFVHDIQLRPMSTWTAEETHRYAIATEQTCDEDCPICMAQEFDSEPENSMSCPDCERPNQFGELCSDCLRERDGQ